MHMVEISQLSLYHNYLSSFIISKEAINIDNVLTYILIYISGPSNTYSTAIRTRYMITLTFLTLLILDGTSPLMTSSGYLKKNLLPHVMDPNILERFGVG